MSIDKTQPVIDLVKELIYGNQLLLNLVSKMSKEDQQEYLPKVSEKIKNTEKLLESLTN